MRSYEVSIHEYFRKVKPSLGPEKRKDWPNRITIKIKVEGHINCTWIFIKNAHLDKPSILFLPSNDTNGPAEIMTWEMIDIEVVRILTEANVYQAHNGLISSVKLPRQPRIKRPWKNANN